MQQMADLGTYLRAIRFGDLVDILLVAALFYSLLFLVRGTRAVQLIRGILLLVLGTFLLSSVANLRAFGWLMQSLLPLLLVSIPVVFQPELRRALEQLGRAGLLLPRSGPESNSDTIVSVVALAARRLSERKEGALIVLERDTALGDLAERGVHLDAEASVELVTQIFFKNSPLHDGAAIVRNGRIAAARVVLPIGDLGSGADAGRGLGTRHLAAITVTETTDALGVVVSEETGTISLARDGKLVRHLDEGELSRLLYRHYVARERPADRWLRPLRWGAAASARSPLSRGWWAGRFGGSDGGEPESAGGDVRSADGEARSAGEAASTAVSETGAER